MTVESTENPRKRYSANGVTTEFTIPFPFIENDHIDVSLYNPTTDVETPWTENSEYTIVDDGSFGKVVAASAPASGNYLIIQRNTPITQGTDYESNRPTPAAVDEAAIDKVTLLIQERLEELSRCLKLPPTSDTGFDTLLPTPMANRAIGWNATADGLENLVLFATTVTVFMETVLNSVDASALVSNAGFLNLNNEWSKTQAMPSSPLSISAGNIALDMSAGPLRTLALTENAFLSSPTGLDKNYPVIVIVTNSGGFSYAHHTDYKFGSHEYAVNLGTNEVTQYLYWNVGTAVYGRRIWSQVL